MSISIRRERTKSMFDEGWGKDYINRVYECCKSQIAELIPHYISSIISEGKEFLGYDFSKEFDNHESKGKFHLYLKLSKDRYFFIQFTAEGKYKEKRDGKPDDFVRVIFSIEQDIKKRYYEPMLSEIDIRDESRKHSEIIRFLKGSKDG